MIQKSTTDLSDVMYKVIFYARSTTLLNVKEH